MVKDTLVIQNQTGLHARPAADLSKLCNMFESTVEIVVDSHTVNAKSIVSILTAGIKRGTEITVCFCGGDEEKAREVVIGYLRRLKE